jgi:hypothetical protein
MVLPSNSILSRLVKELFGSYRRILIKRIPILMHD